MLFFVVFYSRGEQSSHVQCCCLYISIGAMVLVLGEVTNVSHDMINDSLKIGSVAKKINECS